MCPIEIPLTKGMISIVDDDMAHLKNMKWCYNGHGYAIKTFVQKKNVYRSMFLHHAVVGYPLNGLQVDHINGNKLDNRRANLRFVTPRENVRNRRDLIGKKSSKYTGVHWFKSHKKWRARIHVGGNRISLGLFDSEEDAGNAYQNALRKMGVIVCA